MSAPTQAVEGATYPIQPKDIDVAQRYPLIATFGYGEVERVAAEFIQECQKKGEWLALSEASYAKLCAHLLAGYHWLDDDEDRQPFTPDRQSAGKYHLLDTGYMVLGSDGKYRVTEKFIQICHDQHPARRP